VQLIKGGGILVLKMDTIAKVIRYKEAIKEGRKNLDTAEFFLSILIFINGAIKLVNYLTFIKLQNSDINEGCST